MFCFTLASGYAVSLYTRQAELRFHKTVAIFEIQTTQPHIRIPLHYPSPYKNVIQVSPTSRIYLLLKVFAYISR